MRVLANFLFAPMLSRAWNATRISFGEMMAGEEFSLLHFPSRV
jgi:hypothetical protein